MFVGSSGGHIAELGDLAFLLRDVIDGVERDTLEALLDATKFGAIMRGNRSMDVVNAQVAALIDDRLRRLKSNYSTWWKVNSLALPQRLNEFQRALLRAQTPLVLRVAR